MMSYEPMTDDCATKLSACIGEPWTKEGFMYMDKQWKDLLEKKGHPIEAYQDFFQYCFGYKL
jgi:hypothetical protein